MNADCQEISRGVFGALLKLGATRLSATQLESLVEGSGLTLADLADPTGWVSVEFLDLFLERLVTLWGSDDIIRLAGEATFAGSNFGFLGAIFRTADPGPNYQQALGVAALFNKAGRFDVLRSTPRSLRLTYTPVDGATREHSPYNCMMRRAQLSAVPFLLGLPTATVSESTCHVRGDACCTYDVQWQSNRRQWGAISGGVALLLGLGLVPLAGAVAVSTGALLLAVGLYVDMRRRHNDLKQLSNERAESVANSARAVDRKYAELLAAKQAVDEKVAERTQALREAGTALEASLRQVTRLGEQKDRFFENISHELRTPLTLVLAPLEMLAAGGLSEHEQQTTVERMLRSGHRLQRLINQLLDLARADAGQLKLTYEQLNLQTLLSELVAQCQATAVQRGLTLNVDCAGPVELVADGDRVEEMLLNLLGNAMKFTPRGGRVDLRARVEAGQVLVAVADTGIGIPEQDLPSLFDRFVRVEGANRTEGTGIGLSLVRELARLHQGDVEVKSTPGVGTTFTLRLPLGNGATAVPVRGPRAQPSLLLHAEGAGEMCVTSATEAPVGQGPLVFLVEDHDELRTFMTEILSRRFTVRAFPAAPPCLKVLESVHPAVVVSDVMLPGMSGFELARQIRKQASLQNVRIILATALSDSQHAVEGLGSGAHDYVRKPFSPAELLARVETQVALQDLTRRLIQQEKQAMLGTFAAGLAHEVRNPAAAVQACVEPLRRSVKRQLANPTPQLLECIDVIEESARRITALVRDVLDFSQVDRNQLESHELSDGVDRCLRLLASRLPPAVKVERAYTFQEPVRCQAALVNQLLMNLLDNAVRAVGPEGVIQVGTRAEKNGVLVSVQDSGPGMTPETLQRVFDPFFTTREAGQGTGLGLSLSRQIAEAHGGSLSLQSQPGSGTTATLWLPMTQPKVEPVHAA